MDSNISKIQASEGPLALMRPCVDKKRAVRLGSLLFGLRISDSSHVKEFVSYDDRNFYLRGALPDHSNKHDSGGPQEKESEFVLKILNHADSENISYVNAQNEIMLHLNKHGFACPVPAKSLDGEYTVECELKSSETEGDKGKADEQETPLRVYAVRLLSFVPGKLVKDVQCTPDLLFDLGRYVAKMNKALQGFQHPGIGALVKQEWDLSQLFVLESYISLASQDGAELKVLCRVYNKFVNEVIPQLGNLNKHVIHGDLNYENILVIPNQSGDGHEISSVIDFGDSSVNYRLFEVAICMMYMILARVKQGDAYDVAIRVVGYVLCGYQSVYALSHSELSLLYWSIAARFFQSIVIGMYKQSLEPKNFYLSQTSRLGLKILSSYIALSGEEVLSSWMSI